METHTLVGHHTALTVLDFAGMRNVTSRSLVGKTAEPRWKNYFLFCSVVDQLLDDRSGEIDVRPPYPRTAGARACALSRRLPAADGDRSDRVTS